MIKVYHYSFEYIDEMDLIRFLKSLVIIKKDKTEDALMHAQIVSLPHSGEDGWKNFLESWGLNFTPQKFSDLVNSKETDLNDAKAIMEAFNKSHGR